MRCKLEEMEKVLPNRRYQICELRWNSVKQILLLLLTLLHVHQIFAYECPGGLLFYFYIFSRRNLIKYVFIFRPRTYNLLYVRSGFIR